MKIATYAIFAAAALVLMGCAAPHAGMPVASEPTTHRSLAISTMPTTSGDERAFLTIDQIQPTLSAASTQPATAPAESEPLDAIQLFAQARAAFDDADNNTAIALLQHAARIDPQSAEIERMLGTACLREPLQRDGALPAFEKAADLAPDDLNLQLEIARQYIHLNNNARVVDRLHLARLTSGYKTDTEGAAIVDFFLAQALKQAGYDRAALDEYATLLQRLTIPDSSIERNPELMFLTNRPELIYIAMGELYEKHAQYDQALRAYQLAADRGSEDDFASQSRVIRVLAESGKTADAEQRATQLLVKNHSSDASLALLKDIYTIAGTGQFSNALARLHAQMPADIALTTALADEDHADHHDDRAIALLQEASRANGNPPALVSRLFSLYLSSGDLDSALRLLVDSLADHPDALPEFNAQFAQLLRSTGHNRLRMAALQNLKVRPGAESARQFLISRIANLWTRDALARSSIEQSASTTPPFAPAYRALISQYWSRPDWDDAQKKQAVQQIIDRAETEGNPALAAELRGRSLQMQDKYTDALAEFDDSEKKGNKAPDFRLAYAAALIANGDGERASQLLWAIISDWPTYDSAYAQLIDLYVAQKNSDGVEKVLDHWLEADRDSITAQIYAAVVDRYRDPRSTEAELQTLFRAHPDDGDVLDAVQNFYVSNQEIDKYISLLEDERRRHPDNRAAVERLVVILRLRDRVPEALQIIEETRRAVAKDPEMLYYVSSLYSQIDQQEQSEEVLQQVIAMDPTNAAASNDLGYFWADSGKNLSEAERLVRIAVNEEPDNQSYLDSLAWTLYKRGKFDEARVYLDKAIGPANLPDPVVLNHLGDVMYRQSKNDDALKTWKWSLQRIEDMGDDMRDELKKLQVDLRAKIDAAESGKPVNVAPTAAESAHADNR